MSSLYRSILNVQGGVDADAQAFITAASITDPTQQSAINQLVVDLKGYGVWSKMKALYPFVGGTALTHKFNLKDPRDLDAAYRLVFNGGYTHNNLGITGNGTNAYADTKLIPNSGALTLNSTHISVYSRTNKANSNECLIGSATGAFSNNGLLILAYGNNPYIMVNNSTLTNGTGFNTTGLLTATRTTATNQKLFRNTSTLINATSNSTGFSNGRILLNAFIENNISISRYAPHNLAFASIGDGLNDTEAANFYTAVQSFQTTLGRSIGTQTVSDADAQAFVTNAGIVDQVEADAINNLVIGLKADSLWGKMKAIYPFVGGTSTTHKYNLVNPLDTDAAYRLVFNGGWTHSSNGAQPNGTNGYADTKLIPLSVLTSVSGSFGIGLKTNIEESKVDIGVNGTNAGWFRLYSRYAGNLTYWTYGDGYPSGIPYSNTNSIGMWYVVRNGAVNTDLYKNGSLLNSSPQTVTLPNRSIFVGAISNLGTAALFSSKEINFAFVGNGLNASEISNFNTTISNFQTAIGR